MSDQASGYSPVGSPPQSPGLPQNPLPIAFEGFDTLNTKASQQGIGDQEMFVCDGFMPLGKNNLRSLRGIGDAIYTATGGKTIENYSFNNIGNLPVCIVSLSDGSMDQVNLDTMAVTHMATAGTITALPADFNQWAGLYIIIVADQTNGYFLWDGTNLFSAGTIAPQIEIINGGSHYTSPPTINISTGTPATGTLTFNSNPAPGDTITLNSVVYTFVVGSSVGQNVHINGTTAATVGIDLLTVLNASTNPLVDVATYSAAGGPDVTVMTVTYDSGGAVGNSYTLAASAAVPSGGTLTGGSGTSGTGATFAATVANGSVVGVTVTNPGHDFVLTDLFVLTFSGGGSDDSASATPVISTNSGVSAVLVNNGGAGYSSQVQVTATGGGSPSVDATFSVLGQNGVITQVLVQNPGLGYTSTPTLTVADLASGAVGTGAVLTAVLQAGQIESVTLDQPGTGYTTAPTLTVVGDGFGAVLQANLTGSLVDSITVVSAGTGYTQAVVQFNGGNNSAAAIASIMPFGVSGTTVETYQSRVWVGNGRNIQYSAPGSPQDFSAINGAGATASTDSFLRERYVKFIQSNGFLYLFADSSLNYISGVSTTGNPAITTFNNLNVDPQIGTVWRGTVQPFGRDIVFANSVGVHVSYGGAVTKVSDALDGIYTTVPESDWPAGFEPSGAVMTIFGIRVYILALPILDQVSGQQVVKCLMWDGKRWWTSPQEGFINPFIASQDFNSVLTAYCSSNQVTINPMFTTLSENFQRYLYSKLWANPGIWLTKVQRQVFGLMNVNYIDPPATVATGTVFFPSNPAINDTVTLNGIVWTFIAGASSGHNVHINGTTAVTIGVDFIGILNASVDPAISVATYSAVGGPDQTTLHIVYDVAGAEGDSYTLAASAATPSGVALEGGSDGPKIFMASITETGVGKETGVDSTRLGPRIFGPLAGANNGRLMGVRMRTTMADIQINTIMLIDQIQQSNV